MKIVFSFFLAAVFSFIFAEGVWSLIGASWFGIPIDIVGGLWIGWTTAHGVIAISRGARVA